MTEAGTSLAGVMTLDQCWAVSATWYAGRLGMNYQRPPLEHFQSLLHGEGLVGDAWSLTFHPGRVPAQDPACGRGRRRLPSRRDHEMTEHPMRALSNGVRQAAPSLRARVASLDWPRIEAELDERGCALTGALLTPRECAELVRGYDSEEAFRSRVEMTRHGFGRGEYKYFAYPLPQLVATLRAGIYPRLAPIANRWEGALGRDGGYPADHEAYLERCHAAGQTLPTALMLKYGEGDYNCLHQDLYGELVFPLQAAFLLSAPGIDFAGGEFVLTEQRPRTQSRAEVVSLAQGEGVIFAVNERPARGARGVYRVAMRHGVSRLRSGRRFTIGIIFHDAT